MLYIPVGFHFDKEKKKKSKYHKDYKHCDIKYYKIYKLCDIMYKCLKLH